MRRRNASILAAAALTVCAATANAATPNELGTFKSWVALQQGTRADRVCYIYAEPLSKKGRYTKRGDVYVQVVHAPAEKRRNEVLFIAGYTYKRNSTVNVNVDGRRFVLSTEKGLAWNPGSKGDLDMIRAMRRGRRMVVRGRSLRGTLTTDTYSLSGFTAAYRAASRACNVKAR